VEIETSNLVGRLSVAIVAHKRGVVKTREPFKFWRAQPYPWNGNPSSQMWFFIQLCSTWQDLNWLKASRGPSAIAELLVISKFSMDLKQLRAGCFIVGAIMYADHLITFCVGRSQCEMYSGHGRLCVCLSLAAFPHYCTDLDVTWRMVGVLSSWAVGGFAIGARFCCYDNIAPNAKCQRMLVLALCLVAQLVLSASVTGVRKCIDRVKWRHISMVAIRSPFCRSTPSYCA